MVAPVFVGLVQNNDKNDFLALIIEHETRKIKHNNVIRAFER